MGRDEQIIDKIQALISVIIAGIVRLIQIDELPVEAQGSNRIIINANRAVQDLRCLGKGSFKIHGLFINKHGSDCFIAEYAKHAEWYQCNEDKGHEDLAFEAHVIEKAADPFH